MEPTPNASPFEGAFSAVSCATTSACTAVGGSGFPSDAIGNSQTAAAQWNGKAWALEPTPALANAATSDLLSVKCTSATLCEAVGFYIDNGDEQYPLAEGWNGKRWSVQTTPDPQNERDFPSEPLDSVACMTATTCIAVGSNDWMKGSLFGERWNGKTWALQAIPKPSGNVFSPNLYAITCASSTLCTAVGNYTTKGQPTETLVERLNGNAWSIESSPSPAGALSSSLDGVKCANTTTCVAVGSYTNAGGVEQPLAETWNGAAWSIVTTASTGAASAALTGVYCTATNACIATGSETSAGGEVDAMTQTWNGVGWSLQSTPVPAGAAGSNLAGVTCVVATQCVAVGSSSNSSGAEATLAELWNGAAWSIQTTPNPPGDQPSALTAVSCTSALDCVAVGNSTRPGAVAPLVGTWNGSTWSFQAAPAPSGAYDSLFYSVSCLGPAECVAVGSAFPIAEGGTAYTTAPLIESWNGSAWTIQAAPDPASAVNSVLTSVSCTSSTSCMAVGESRASGGASSALAEMWNGATWAIENAEPAGVTYATLGGVSCVSSTVCTAAGGSQVSGQDEAPLVEHWNGSTWSVVSVPDPSTSTAQLTAVACVGTMFCSVVGSYTDTSNETVTLAENWNGVVWAIQSTPVPPSASSYEFDDITCLSSSSCEAVGDQADTSALAEGWNGVVWTVQTTPNFPTAEGTTVLAGVACAAPAECQGVGSDWTDAGETQVALAEAFS